MQRFMKHFALAGIATFGLALSPASAQARDLCMQLSTDNGNSSCDFTGDAGFFRFFRAKLPKNARRPVELHGRNGGISAVYGTMVMDSSGSQISLAASFSQDAFYGTIDLFIDPADPTGDHFGYGSYGDVTLSNSCNAKIVDCSLEP